jgi:predicted DNA-binding transcriptional regulator AlpA
MKTYTSFEDLPLVLDVVTVSKILGISRNKAYELSNSEGFPVLKLGKRKVVPKQRFIEWLEAR